MGQVEAKKKQLEQLLSSYEERQTHMQKLNQGTQSPRVMARRLASNSPMTQASILAWTTDGSSYLDWRQGW